LAEKTPITKFLLGIYEVLGQLRNGLITFKVHPCSIPS
jgi:hypothetical protein